jgi:hypothetical protein
LQVSSNKINIFLSLLPFPCLHLRDPPSAPSLAAVGSLLYLRCRSAPWKISLLYLGSCSAGPFSSCWGNSAVVERTKVFGFASLLSASTTALRSPSLLCICGCSVGSIDFVVDVERTKVQKPPTASALAALPFRWDSSDPGVESFDSPSPGTLVWASSTAADYSNNTCRLPVCAAPASALVPAQTDALHNLFIRVQASPTTLQPTAGELDFSDSGVFVASLRQIKLRALL